MAEIKREKQNLTEAIIRVDKEVIKYLGEQKYYHGFITEKQMNDVVEITFLTASIEGLARWIIMFGDHTEIIQPNSLRSRISELATAIQKKFSK